MNIDRSYNVLAIGNLIPILVIILLLGLNYLSNENIYEHTWIQAFFYIAPTIVLLIVNSFFLIPKLFDKGKYAAYSFALIILILITQALTGYFTIPHYFNYQIGILILDFTKYFITASAVFGFISMQRLAQQNKRNYEQALLIKQSELKSLKSQINPHFLFNNLNNIYYLCLEKSDLAAEVVEKLANLLRYTLENTDKEFVPLEKEYLFIKNYIDLEKSRLPASGKITLTRKGDFTNCKIAPLILITFVENCFKHGANKNAIDPVVDVFLEYKQGELIFFCENNTFEKGPDYKKLGTGLANVKTRLALLYPNRHNLEIEEHEKTFTVNLIINL